MSLKAQNRELQMFLQPQKAKKKTQELKVWYFVLNLVFRPPPLLLATICCLFFTHFEQFQRLQMRYLKIYKACLLKNWCQNIRKISQFYN
jgi:hypothetical protein